jgi:hypothetical protein
MIGQHRTGFFLEPDLVPLSRNEQFVQRSGQASKVLLTPPLTLRPLLRRFHADRAQIGPRHLQTNPLQELKFGLKAGGGRENALERCGESKLKMAQMQPTAEIESEVQASRAARPLQFPILPMRTWR